VRGGLGITVPFGHEAVREARARTTFFGNLAAGYYFTPHDATPVGDLVFYVASSLLQLTDDRGPATTTLTIHARLSHARRRQLVPARRLDAGVVNPATGVRRRPRPRS
jgi:hypothetical protein